MLLTHLLRNGFVIEDNKPTLYVRGDRVSFNFYTAIRHPNDKGNRNNKKDPNYKIHNWNTGDSKGKKIGLEEAGWVGIRKH